MRPLKIYTDQSLIPNGAHMQWLLHPLLDPQLAVEDSSRRYRRIYRNYYKVAADLFDLVSLEEADVAMLPADWSAYQGSYSWSSRSNREDIASARRFSEKARRLGKPVIVFFSGERSHENVPLPGAYVFRKSIYRSKIGKRDFVIPHVSYLDLIEQLGLSQPTRRVWNMKPTAGFCGLARSKRFTDYPRQFAANFFHFLREGSCAIDQFKGLSLRQRILQILGGSGQIKTDFIMRDKSFFPRQNNKEWQESARTEFLKNMCDSDYQVCVRGSANYSRRPWEAMCAGRIPLFVDTDCVLPFSGEVDWSKLMVVIDENDVNRLPEAVMDFHSCINDESYQGIQSDCRSAWERYLTPEGLAGWLRVFWGEKLVT